MAQIVHVAGIASVFIYGGVAAFLHFQGFQHPMPDLGSMLRLPLLAVGIVTLAMVPLLNRIALKTSGREELPELLSKLRGASVIAMACCEAPALYGLVLFLATGIVREAAVLAAAGFLGLLIWFPTERAWAEHLKQAIAATRPDAGPGAGDGA